MQTFKPSPYALVQLVAILGLALIFLIMIY